MDVSNVRKGIKFLDALAAEGRDDCVKENWREKVDWSENRFFMRLWANCVWGQLHSCQSWSEYVESMIDVGLSTEKERYDHGFEIEDLYEGGPEWDEEWDKLTESWQMYANHTLPEDLSG
jgi:hypothetical protein